MAYSAFHTPTYYPDRPFKAQDIPQGSSVTHYSNQGEDEDVQFQESQIPLDAAFLAEVHLERSLLESPNGEYQVEPDIDRDGNSMHIDDHGAQCHGPPLCEVVLSPDMRACRDGFISNFKHDKMGMASSHDQDLIIETRHFHRWADCKLDACLYRKTDPEGREDTWNGLIYTSYEYLCVVNIKVSVNTLPEPFSRSISQLGRTCLSLILPLF